MPHGLEGLKVLSVESRRSAEMAALIRNYGGEVIQAPSVREVPLHDQREALAFGEALFADACDVLVLMTGVGTRLLVTLLAQRWPKDDLVRRLGRLALVCRGPKPVAALREIGLSPTLTVPEPNTWRDLLAALDRQLPVGGKRVAVQEYGARNEELLAGLSERGAVVTAVPVYSWALPEDVGPLRAAIRRLALGEVDVAVFTSRSQIDSLFQVAAEIGMADAVRGVLRDRTVVASIGPVTSEALEAHGVRTDLHPEHPRMGHLVTELARRAAELLRTKRG
jgi:uroporphyrinogen-III synthase